MGYEPPVNDPFFYSEGEEEETFKCFICGYLLDEDDIVWADVEGQILKDGNDCSWCVSCLPAEKEEAE